MLEDVTKRVWYAFSTGNHANPYDKDDKRHDRFTRELHRVSCVDSDFEDMCSAMGTDTRSFTRRVHPYPGPVIALADLI